MKTMMRPCWMAGEGEGVEDRNAKIYRKERV